MNQRIFTASLFCSLVLAAVSAVAGIEQNAMQRIADENKMLQMKEILRKQDVEITFYGKIIDQYGDLIKDANVEIHITQFNPDMDKLFGQVKTVHAQTDAAGIFSVEKEKGRSIYVEGMSKAGYEYLRSQNPTTSFQFAEHGITKPFVADKSSPVIFKLRKQGATAFCLEAKYWDCQITAGESGKTKGYDFISRKPVPNLMSPVLNGETLTCDLMVKATLNTNNATWTVVLSPGGTNEIGRASCRERVFRAV